MTSPRRVVERYVFGGDNERRFTQDSPIMPDVWIGYGWKPVVHGKEEDGDGYRDLILTPHCKSSPGKLAKELRARLGEKAAEKARIAHNDTSVVARITFEELVRCVLPLSGWWRTHAAPGTGHETWLARIVGVVRWLRSLDQTKEIPPPSAWPKDDVLVRDGKKLVGKLEPKNKPDRPDLLWSVNRNRPAKAQVWKSAATIKADAAVRLFNIRCDKLTFAVVDSGIDAQHPAFLARDASGKPILEKGKPVCRVTATYDFTRLRDLLDPDKKALGADTAAIKKDIREGRAIDWTILEKHLAVPHGKGYVKPKYDHGTHVAGILGCHWPARESKGQLDNDLVGICPDIRLWDLRVLGDDGSGDEFSIMAALQFLRFKNQNSDVMAVQGANLSFSLRHYPLNYACGRTPVCEEAERLVAAGVVVVSAAGNEGRLQYVTPHDDEPNDLFADISITDPGNAEEVITVGSTHRHRPHTFGVSYFSSRGPTGDGRNKPDLVAPGEKIKAPVPGALADKKDGTSMAAPHVSGAAALLMARHDELIGDPRRIKEVLCKTATDLGRERYFQGAGMVDILRALQSV
ncbi:MAG: S8 family serine peptidase [Deltaproteobacteria bacterium]|nr:S8 family serine peptidase [Deltaproteobacteria bacterium]